MCRANQIYYSFKLYEDNEPVEVVIEGVFNNTSPKLTHDDYYPGEHDNRVPFPRAKYEFVDDVSKMKPEPDYNEE